MVFTGRSLQAFNFLQLVLTTKVILKRPIYGICALSFYLRCNTSDLSLSKYGVNWYFMMQSCLTHKWHVTVRTVGLSPAKVVSEVLVGGIEDNPAIKGWGVEQR